jgi:hypothetical protein
MPVAIEMHPWSLEDMQADGTTPVLRTNRDLYLAIHDLTKQQKNCTRSLEEFLRAVLNRSAKFSDCESLTLAGLYELLASGFTYEPAPFDQAWRDQYAKLPRDGDGYAGWRATIIRQIVDLREMDECGTLKNEMRYFGVSTPRHSYWFNFDPFVYLECGLAGSFGGWLPNDETGRQYVPGPVAVLADDGSIQTANPEDLPIPIFEISTLSWEQFNDFLMSGQHYE